jgi:hypothetical protein
MSEVSDWWDVEDLLPMLERCDDDVAAFLMASNAFTPDELRALSLPLGLPDVDNLRELTLLTVLTARRVTGEQEQKLRKWAALWWRSPRAATRIYLEEQRARP